MSASANSVPMSQLDRQSLLKLLRESRQRFLASFAGVSDEESRCRPAEGSWSVLDTVEHLTCAETTMLKLITGERRPRTPNAPNREEVFLHAVADRSRKLRSPDIAVPRGRFVNLNEAATRFRESREAILRFVEECPEDLRTTEVTHPHALAGVVSSFELMIIVARHSDRHALQIEEIKNGPAFRAQAKARG